MQRRGAAHWKRKTLAVTDKILNGQHDTGPVRPRLVWVKILAEHSQWYFSS